MPVVWFLIAASFSVQSGHWAGVSQGHRVDHQVLVSDCNATASTAARLAKKPIKGELHYTDRGAECRLNIPKGVTLTQKQWQIVRTAANPNSRLGR